MMFRSTAMFACLLACLLSAVQGQEASEKYLYVIYYEDDGCNNIPTSIIGFVGDDDDLLYGGNSTTGLCATEGVCLIDSNSEQCQALERTVNGTMTFSIDDTGLIFQCDETNVDGECSFLDSCYGSSAYPSCFFIVQVSSNIADDPNGLIQNADPVGVEEQGYLHFYSDDSCSQWEGSQGILNGETTYTSFEEDADITCRDAMACIFNPEGATCQGYDVPTSEYTVFSGTLGDDATLCASGNSTECVVQDPTACMESPIVPQCYYKWSSAAAFLKEPTNFIPVGAYAATDPQSPIDDNAGPDPTDQESAGATTNPPVTGTSVDPGSVDDSSDAAYVHSSFMMMAVVTMMCSLWL